MGALVIGDGPLARALTAHGPSALAGSILWHPSGTIPAGAYGVVVCAPPLFVAEGSATFEADVVTVRRAIEAAEALNVPLVLASRLSVVGARKGLVPEEDPRKTPFGARVAKGIDLDVEREVTDLENVIAWAEQSARHADRTSHVVAAVKRDLLARRGATSGSALARALADALAVHAEAAGAAALRERAAGWGFPLGSSYALRGYTTALAELLAVRSRVPWAIVRTPDVVEDEHGALAQMIARVHEGTARFPLAERARLEALPLAAIVDAVSLVARSVETSKQGGVVHVTTSERAPLSAPRLLDLVDLHVRKRASDAHVDADTGAPRALDVVAVDRAAVRSPLADAGASLFKRARSLARSAGADRALETLAARVGAPASLTDTLAKNARALSSVVDVDPRDRSLCSAPPFFTDDTRFSTRGLRAAAVREGLTGYVPASESVQWRDVLLRDVLPSLSARTRALTSAHAITAQREAAPAYDSLAHLVIEIGEKFGPRTALSMFQPPNSEPIVVDVTYRQLLARARAAALRLQRAGVQPGDRVIIGGANHPSWGIVAFGVLLARATLVPLDPNLDASAVKNVVAKARPRLAVVDRTMRERLADDSAPNGTVLPDPVLDLHLTAVEGPGLAADAPLPSPDDVASILFTSGTTGTPKGVMLTHANFCALLASLQSVFPTYEDDSMLSVLPLHHTFEFSCGFLMALASGGRIFTPHALTGESVLFSLKHGKITALVGVPALWQLLERRISKRAAERGDTVKSLMDALLAANRAFGKATGMSFGKLALRPIHDELGGHLRVIISGGSALPPAVHELFQGIGLPLAEGYGLTESAPVLTVAEGKMGMPAGTVGKAIPGVELKIVDADPNTGVGEVWARAPNVMKGYFEDESATRATLEDGWLKTGDLGLLDDAGVLKLVGRSKDVVVSAAGENIYLDDVEKLLEPLVIEDVLAELSLLGIADPRGGERLALVCVPHESKRADPTAVMESVKARVQKLASYQRAAVIELVEGPLPRTSTRKVKRKDLRVTVEAIVAERERLARESKSGSGDAPMAFVRNAIALAVGVDAAKLTAATRFQQDLGFDSLMWVEVQGALGPLLSGAAIDPEKLAACESVADLEQYVRELATSARGGPLAAELDDARAAEERARTWTDVALPLVKPLGRRAISFVQREAYRTLFQSTVTGRAFIPHNRNTLVIANHTSHLDTGLVKFALGKYGEDIRPLAAKDYFFEGAPAKVAFFEHFTNLVPIDRETGSGLAFEQAKAIVDAGHTALIFPEGTRRADGTLGSFKPLVARLALATQVDVLPIFMKGNYEALPRGVYVPNLAARHLEAHIGPPLEAKEMARLTAHLPNVQAARAATELIRKAIVALSRGRMLDLSRVRSLDDVERGLKVRAAE